MYQDCLDTSIVEGEISIKNNDRLVESAKTKTESFKAKEIALRELNEQADKLARQQAKANKHLGK
jgi:ribonuclease HI